MFDEPNYLIFYHVFVKLADYFFSSELLHREIGDQSLQTAKRFYISMRVKHMKTV